MIIVMPRASEINSSVDWLGMLSNLEGRYINDPQVEFLLSDFKPSNWGILNGKIVKIDYGDKE